MKDMDARLPDLLLTHYPVGNPPQNPALQINCAIGASFVAAVTGNAFLACQMYPAIEQIQCFGRTDFDTGAA